MKPWERNWETQETQSKPWERDWTDEQINPKDYNGSFLQSTDGSDAKPFDKLDYFLNFYHINTPGVKRTVQKLSWIPKSFEGDLDYGEVGKGLARGSLEIVKGTGGLIKITGDWFKGFGIDTPLGTLKPINVIGVGLTKTGQFIKDLADMGLVSDMLEQDSETFKGSFTENPSLTRTLSTVASAIPSLGYGKIVSKFTNPAFGVTMMAGVDTQDIYWEAKEKGLNKLEAGALFTVATAGTYKLEKIGFDSIFDKKVTPLATKIVGSMLSEGLTEAGQTLWQNSVKKIGYERTQDLFEGVVESLVAGAGSGGLTSTAVGISNKLSRAEKALKEQGYSDKDIEVMEDAVGGEMVAHKDTIEPMFQDNIQESINNLNALKEKFAGLPEQTRLQISRELEGVYGTVRENLKGIVDDVEADSIAKLQQGRALYMYEATGMMPSEYAKKITEIRRAENIEKANFNKDMFFQESLDIAKQNDELDAKYPAYEGGTIAINGQDKTVYNSSGERIAKSKEALENFYRWFGDSKVVDKKGRPLIVYHGTRQKGITEFKSPYADKLIFFAYKKEFADNWAKNAPLTEEQTQIYRDMPNFSIEVSKKYREKYGENWAEDESLIQDAREERDNLKQEYLRNAGIEEITMPVYLKAKNTFKPAEHWDLVIDEIEKYYDKDYRDENADAQTKEYLKQIQDGKWIFFEHENVIKKIRDLGFDSIELEEISGQGVTTIAVFEGNNQIKSTSNRGTFDINEDNIYYQSAFAGSRVDYDRPSLEAIGSGEGAQAHGWGLYYALNKDVAERYRENFTRGARNLEYDGKEIKYMRLSEKKKAPALKRVIHDFVYNSFDDISDMIPEKLQKMKDYYEREVRNSSVINDKERGRLAAENLEALKDFDISKLKEKKQGQVHEVDIPENPYLLDEQAGYGAQPELVKKVFDRISEEFGIKTKGTLQVGNEQKEINGKYVYNHLADKLGNPKQASIWLNKQGIKGITYDGKQDGRCFVIFNPADVKVIQKFYQNESSPYGAYSNNIIYLFQKANRSTLVHELAHSWHNELLSMQEYDKVKQDLETFDRWSESEFNRKYNVEKRANGYAVVNKQGNVVYDKSGNGFVSEQDAKDYAKEELFARGFEEYLREGKAPSNALKQAFRNFLMWLKKIYKDAMALNIELSPDMKNFYADILGGADLDFFLNSTPETFIENRVKLGQERESELDSIISEAQSKKFIKAKPINKRLKDIWTVSAIPLSTRAKRVNLKLRTRLRRYEFGLLTNLRDRYNKALPFLDIWKKMSENDAIAFDLALKNDYVAKQLEIVDKYNARKEWESVRELLTSIYDDAINAGLDLNYRPDYFPRKVKDVDGFLSYLKNSPNWTRFEEALRDADPENVFTVEEKADFLNKYLRGYIKVDMLPNKYSSEKERKIDIIDNVMNQYYSDSIESLIMYVEGMNKRIEAAKFLGKDSENYDESIGGYLTYLLNNNIINPKQVDEVRDILRARLGEQGVSNEGLKTLRDISYMYTMGGINSAITQIDDLATSLYKAGVWNTLSSALSAKRITKKDLGLDVISDEFRDSSATAKALNELFKITGLDGIDSFAKETLVNAMLKKYRQYSDETLRSVIEPIMEDDTAQTIEDIKNNNITDNVLFLLFNDLSDIQPISKSELPAFYNTSGNLRILYMLKSFMIKRIDIFRNECFDKIKDPKTRKEGVQNLVRLTVFMMLMGASKDMLIDLLYGRDVEMSETMVNNALGLAGISKFQVYQAKEKGFTGVIKDFVVPPIFAVYDDLINDISKVSEGKRDLKNLEVLKGIPLVGRFYYWWVGRGKEKLEKRNKKTY